MPVLAARQSEGYIYELDNGVIFDANTRKIRKGDFFVAMTTQTAELLKEFLDAEDYKLSIDEIQEKMWGVKQCSTGKVYITIKRLRDQLSEISACTIINVGSAYQLKIPDNSFFHSILKKKWIAN